MTPAKRPKPRRPLAIVRDIEVEASMMHARGNWEWARASLYANVRRLCRELRRSLSQESAKG